MLGNESVTLRKSERAATYWNILEISTYFNYEMLL